MAEPEGGLSPTEYAVGIFLVCLGCAFASTGLLLMKESTVHEGERPFFLRWRWLIGFCFLGILTTVVDVYVLGILPLSLVAPFAGLTIVFTLLIASSGLMDATEKLSTSDVVGAGLIIAGVTLVSVYGPGGAHGSDASSGGDADSSSDDAGGGGGGGGDDEAAVDDPALAAFQRPLFAGFAGGSLSTVLVWCAVLLIRPTAAATSAGTALSAYSAAVCGALSQLFVKVVAVCLHKADGDFTSPASPFRSLAPYFALGGVAFTAPLQLFLLDTALTGASVAYAVPCYQALLIGLTTVAGGIFFDEFGNMQRSQMAGFGVGVALATCGLALLSARPGDEEAEEEVAMGEAPMRLSQKAEEAPPSPVTLDRSLSTLTPLSNEARASTEWTREERLFARRFSLALRGLPRDVLGLGMLNEKLRRGKRFRARALSFDNHHIYLRFRDREEEAAAARAPKPPTWRRSNTMSELPADRRTARQAAERHYSTRRSPLSRLSPLGRRSPDKRRTDDTASLI